MEADTKHAMSIVKDLGLMSSRVAVTPGVKDRHEKVQQEKEKQMQEGDQSTGSQPSIPKVTEGALHVGDKGTEPNEQCRK